MPQLDIQLVYLELPAGQVTEFRQTFSFAELADFISSTTAVYLAWWNYSRVRHVNGLRETVGNFWAQMSGA